MMFFLHSTIWFGVSKRSKIHRPSMTAIQKLRSACLPHRRFCITDMHEVQCRAHPLNGGRGEGGARSYLPTALWHVTTSMQIIPCNHLARAMSSRSRSPWRPLVKTEQDVDPAAASGSRGSGDPRPHSFVHESSSEPWAGSAEAMPMSKTYTPPDPIRNSSSLMRV